MSFGTVGIRIIPQLYDSVLRTVFFCGPHNDNIGLDLIFKWRITFTARFIKYLILTIASYFPL